MKKIFIFNENRKKVHIDYTIELNKAYEIFKKDKNTKKISFCDLKNISFSEYQIIIFNYLPQYLIRELNKKKKILIKINKFNRDDKYVDFFIDKKLKDKNSSFRVIREKITYDEKNDINFKKVINIFNFLEWDTNFWKFKIASLDSYILTKSIIFQLNNFIKKNNIRLIQYLCNFHNSDTTYLAEKNNFQLKDIRYSFNINLLKFNDIKVKTIKGIKLKKGTIKDYKKIYKNLNNTYLESRYYFDNKFPKKMVKKFYQNWLFKAFKSEFDDECILGIKNNKIIGFCTLRYENENKKANIGLFAIMPKHRNKNYAKSFLLNIVRYVCKLKNYNELNVVTQSRNYIAQRLYQECGFKTLSNKIWYHKWIK